MNNDTYNDSFFKKLDESYDSIELTTCKKELFTDLNAFRLRLEEHTNKKINGKDLKNFIREMHSSLSFSYLAYNKNSQKSFKDFEHWLSMYESNALRRGPPDGYIGDTELREYAQALLDAYPKLPIE